MEDAPGLAAIRARAEADAGQATAAAHSVAADATVVAAASATGLGLAPTGAVQPSAAVAPSAAPAPVPPPEALVAFAKARRPAWLAWLQPPPDPAAGGGDVDYRSVDQGQALMDPQWNKPLLDPRRYLGTPLLEGFWRSEQTAAAAAADVPGAASSAGPGVAHLVLLCVHAHHRFRGPAAVAVVRGAFGFPPTTVVALPCCATFNPTGDIGRRPDLEFEDVAIFSACRKVLVWKWAAGAE